VSKRVVLAYSGGLDTSVAVKWLQEEMDFEVITLAADIGQGDEDWDAIQQRALGAGAVESIVLDLRAEFADDYLAPVIKANALYEGVYPLVSALSRPLITKHLVKAARDHGATWVSHGCTGKGNDQVRFEVSARALDPELDIVAPARVWGFSREDSIDYAARHNIPIASTKEKIYSIDANLWGRAIECGEMEDPWNAPPEGVWQLTKETVTEPREITISFEAGIPVSVDGVRMPLFELILKLNDIVGAYGYGRMDMVENRRVGIKSREVYESPAGLALIQAHGDLESVCLERDLHHYKMDMVGRYSELIYDGLWFSPLREAMDRFIDESQQVVNGDVRLGLAPGRCWVLGRRSETGLYDYGLATYDPEDTFRHEDAEGFVRIWGLGLQTRAARQGMK